MQKYNLLYMRIYDEKPCDPSNKGNHIHQIKSLSNKIEL